MAARRGKPRVMVDASLLIAASSQPRWQFEVLRAGLWGKFRLVLSPYVLRQTRFVLERRFPAQVLRFAEFVDQAAFELTGEVAPAELKTYKGFVGHRPSVPVMLAAIGAGVDFLVSEDRHLTVPDSTTAFLRQHVTVMPSAEFLRHVLGWTADALEAIRYREWQELYC